MPRRTRTGIRTYFTGTRGILDNRVRGLEKEKDASLKIGNKIMDDARLLARPHYELVREKEEQIARIEHLLKTADRNATTRAREEVRDAFSKSPKGKRALKIRRVIKAFELLWGGKKLSKFSADEINTFRTGVVLELREKELRGRRNALAAKHKKQ